MRVANTTVDGRSGAIGEARRSSSAIPQRRRCSRVRTLVVFARGLYPTRSLRSTTTQRIPRRPSSMAAARPTGPAPTMTTSASPSLIPAMATAAFEFYGVGRPIAAELD